jgi:hypothetical protein
MTLQPLVEAAGCGFDLDPARGELLLITVPSVLEMTELGGIVLKVRSAFTPRSGPRTPRPEADGKQLALDLD